MKPWKRLQNTQIIKSNWRCITVKTFELPDGTEAQFDVFDKDGIEHAGVIALTPQKEVVIAEQFRAGPEAVMAEIPGGSVGEAEEPEAAATRELLEETGYVPGSIEYMGHVFKDPYMNATWHYFIAYDCMKQTDTQQLDEAEIVNVKHITIDELLDNANNARMTDVEAVLLAYERLAKLRGGIEHVTTKNT